jgi:APA family basic amino acid/polyamine antiporter
MGQGVMGPRKTVDETMATTEEEGFKLKKELGALDVTVLGIGVMIGAGIFVLTGQAAADEAGPAITISFVLAAIVCALAALCYAELAAMVPAAGSAYTFTYATLGELIAFTIGWDLVLEFTVGASAVAVGWSAYLNATLDQLFGYTLPASLSAPPGADGGFVNLPAMLVIIALGALLVRGIRITAKANIGFVIATIIVLLVVIAVGVTEVKADNWSPYFPFGFSGVIGGAALVFFAFIGFDIVATAAEETRNPQRDMPIGIVASLTITTILYVAVAAVVTGMVIYKSLGSAAPVADAFDSLNKPFVASFVYVGALVALTNTVLILMLGQTRVAFAMARDRLLPVGLAKTHPTYGTPSRLTIIFTGFIALIAGFTTIDTLAELVNIGTLFAFVLVAIGVLLLRRSDPDRPRPFRVPGVPVIPVLSVIGSAGLMLTLSGATWVRFVVWMLLGLVVYFAYARSHSAIGRTRDAE